MSRIASATRLDVEHHRSGPNREVVRLSASALLQDTDDRLRAGQIAAVGQNNHPVARALEYRHLAKLGKIIHFRVRA